MPAPAVAFALLQLAAVVVKGALAIKDKTDASAEAGRITGFVLNESDTDYDVTYYEPNHGKWLIKPDAVLSSIPASVQKLETRARTALGQGAKQSEIDQWARQHATTNHPEDVKDNHVEFGGEGLNVGTELAIILTEKHDPDSRIVLMIRKRPGGDYGAGISMSNGPWFANNGYLPKDDDDGSEISDHIQTVRTKRCQFSAGEHLGDAVVARLNGVKVTTQARKVALFTIENDY